MATKKYVSLEKLGLYDEKIKAKIAADDAATLAAAKAHAESLGDNYDAAGSAATVQGNLDTEATRAKAEEERIASLVSTAQKEVDDLEGVVAGKADQIALDALAGKVGTVPEGSTVMGIISSIQESAYDDTALRAEMATELGKKADKTQVATDIENAVKAEKEARETAVAGVQGQIDTIKGDYLKAADKTELEGKISAKADQTALDAVSAVANAAVKQSDYDTKVKALEDEDVRIVELVEAEAERAAGVEESLQTQINTIMNNPDAEGAINSINEFTKYVADHGTIAEGFRTDINALKEVVPTLETKEDATAKYDEVKAEIAAIPQADWNQNDETAADYVKNRTHYDNSSIDEYLLQNIPMSSMTQGSMGVGHIEYPDGAVPTWEAGKTYYLNIDGAIYSTVAESGRLQFDLVAHPSNPASNLMVTLGNTIMIGSAYDYSYDWANSDIVFSIYSVTHDLKQLDEKFIPDTIARMSDIEALDARVNDNSIDVFDAMSKASANEQAIAALQGEDTAIKERLDAVEALMGDGEGSVADQIADVKAELQGELATAIEGAKTDASNKDAVVLAEAQKGIDAAQTAIDTHTSNADIHVTAEQKTAWTTAAGKAHEHSNLSVLEGITSAKVTAWDGKADKATTLAGYGITDAYTKTETDTAITNAMNQFVECSEEEIQALFQA